MPRFDDSLSLSALARLGFVGLSTASAVLRELAEIAGVATVGLMDDLRSAASKLNKGDSAALLVERQGSQIFVPVKVG